MSLSPDALEFQQKVAKAPISGNIDNPEGGFDALVQVKFIYTEKAAKFCEISTLLLSYIVPVKVEISQNFVAFPE